MAGVIAVLVIMRAASAWASPATVPLVTDGSVSALATSGSTLYFGGTFSRVSANPLGEAASISATSGAAIAQAAVSGGEVLATVADGSGGWYLGGTFTAVGGQARSGLAHLRPDGSVDPSFAPTMSAGGQVSALALSGGRLYVGGRFTSVDGSPRDNLAAVNADGSLDTTFDASITWSAHPGSASVSALAVSGATLYVGGRFSQVDGVTHQSVAAVDTTDGSVDATFTASVTEGGLPASVYTLLLSGSELYVGGSFESVDSTMLSSGLAAVDTSTGALNTTFKPRFVDSLGSDFGGGPVYALALSGTTLYVGGRFDEVDGEAQENLAAISAVDGSRSTTFSPNPGIQSAGNTGARGEVCALELSGSTLYIGGRFTQVSGVTRTNLAAVDTSDDSATTWSPEPGGVIRAVALAGSQVEAGGDLRFLGGVARSNLAAMNTADGTLDPTFAPAITLNQGFASVNALVLAGDSLYVGGAFDEVNGAAHTDLAALHASDGTLIPTFDPSVQNGSVAALAVSGSTLYVDGAFESLDTTGAPGLDAVHTSDGTLEPTVSPAITVETPPIPGSEPGSVSSLLLSGARLYFGGNFDHVNGIPRSGLAALSTTDGSLDPSFTPTVTMSAPFYMPTTALTLAGSTLYLGGQFAEVDGVAANGLAAVNADTGTLLAGFSPSLSASEQPGPPLVSALVASGGSLYLGGAFATTDGVPRTDLAAIAPASGALDTEFDPNPTAPTNRATGVAALAISSDGSQLYIGGGFNAFAGQPAGGLATTPITLTPEEPKGGGAGGGTGGSTESEQPFHPNFNLEPPDRAHPNPNPPIPPAASAMAIQTALAAALRSHPPSIARLLKAGSYSLSFAMPGPGALTVEWITPAAHATRHTSSKPVHVLLAAGSHTFKAAAPGTVKLRLMAAGRKLLAKSKSLRVIERATFKPTSGSTQVKQVALSIRGGTKTEHR
jgi:hypothetical protein